jgi:hypothetical protein
MSHPRRDLEFNISRRAFWKALAQEAFVASRALKGEDSFPLSELGHLPDVHLARIKPVIHPLCEIYVDDGSVCSRYKDTGASVELFPLAQVEDRVTLGMFDGGHTLHEVGIRLSQALAWDEARAFAHARDLFLSLAERMICIPSDPRVPVE